MNLEEAYDQALRAWLGEKQSENKPSRETQKYIDALLWILSDDAKDPNIADAIKGLLKPYLGRKPSSAGIVEFKKLKQG